MFEKQIVPPVLPEVQRVIGSLEYDLYSKQDYNTSIINWLKPVIDLTGFNVYPMNGITHCIDYWLSKEKRTVMRKTGDYEWVSNSGNEILYMTNPSSIDGNFCNIPSDIPVVLDIAYVGTTKPQRIVLPPNVEKVFFSLSKPFGLQHIRTGWYFTRRPDYMLNKLTIETKYYNYFSHHCAEKIIDTFPIDYTYLAYKDVQHQLCKTYNLEPSDSVWLATTHCSNYAEFMRIPGLARLSLCHHLGDNSRIVLHKT